MAITKLFIGGFPLEHTEMELVQLVAPYGDVSTIKIVRDRKTKKCKGYAFIEMKDESHALNAMAALDGAELQGRALKLNIVPDAPAKPAPPQRTYTRLARPGEQEKPRRPRLNKF